MYTKREKTCKNTIKESHGKENEKSMNITNNTFVSFLSTWFFKCIYSSRKRNENLELAYQLI